MAIYGRGHIWPIAPELPIETALPYAGYSPDYICADDYGPLLIDGSIGREPAFRCMECGRRVTTEYALSIDDYSAL